MTETESDPSSSDHSVARRRTSRLLTGLGSAALLLTLVFGWAADTLFDSSEFADRAVAVLDDDEVDRLLSEKLTDQIVAAGPEDLLSVKPVIEVVTLEVVRSSAFQDLARTAVTDLHEAFFSEGRDSVVLNLADVVSAVILRLQGSNPDIAAQIPDDVQAGALRISDRSFATETLQLAEQTRALAVVFPALTVALWAGAIAVAKDRRDAVSLIGFSAIGVSLLLLLILAVGIRLLQAQADTAQAQEVIDVVWASFTQPLRSSALVVGISGTLVAATAVAVVKPIAVADQLRAVGERLARQPESELGRAAWAAAAIGLGLLVVVQWQLVTQLIIWAIGFSLLFAGLNEIIRLTGVGQVAGLTPEQLQKAQLAQARVRTRRLIRGGVLVGLVLGVGALGFGLWQAITSGPSPAVEIAGGCNGHEELCDTPLDRVALASTHNSMSAADYPRWLFAEQVSTIEEQLDDGIRGLLIDTWYGAQTDRGIVATDFDGGKSHDELVELYDEPTVSSCDANRGLTDSPLFLLNHWVTTDPPSPSVAAEADDYDVLFGRAIRCGQERSLVPNLVAVNLYAQGDLLAVVDTLNGVSTEAEGDPTPE